MRNKKSFLQKGSVARRLALMTLFGVGFVLPGLNNMALANYGGYTASVKAVNAASGYEVLTGCDTAGATQSLTLNDFTTSSGNAYWAKNKIDTYDGNYVVLKGTDSVNYTFKVMSYSSANATSGTVTLWSYRNNSSAGTLYGITTFGANATYSTSKLREFMTGSVASTLSNYTGAMVAYTASGSAASEQINGAAANGDLIWAPSRSEVKNGTDGGMWELSEVIQRAEGYGAWLRSCSTYSYPYCLDNDGYIYDISLSAFISVRPALQLKIASTNLIAFTSDAANITVTTMTTGNAGSHEYGVEGSKTATFTPTSGVILDNLSISVTADGGGYAAAGLLTTNTGTAWSDISGDISHMATGTTFNLTNADATDRVLRIFGVDDTNKKVTELATGAIAGLSKGNDGKIHMKVSGTVNAGVPVTLTNGASADLAGTANNSITVTDIGENGGCLGGEGTLTGEVKGAGTLTVTGTITAAADRFTQTGGLKVKNNLTFTSRGLNVSTVGGFTQEAGSNVTVDASKIQADSNDPAKAMFKGVDAATKLNVSAGNLTLTGTVQEGKYYVLVAGTAVSDKSLTAANLWNIDNITVEGMFNVEYAAVATGDSSIAIQVTNATTYEEVNTSGLAAVQQGNISVAKEFTGEVENHLGFINRPSLKGDKAEVRDVVNEKVTNNADNVALEVIETGKAADIMPVQVADEDKYDKEVWASYIRTKETTEGMKLEGIEGNNTAQYNGAVVGVDFYSSDKAIAGVAFSYTTGDIDSYSGTTATRNKSKYYGVSFYDRVTNGNNALIYDIGYIKGDNDISQFYTGKETTADVKTDTYTAGVRYEAEFGTEKSRVVPFASFRYMRQNNKDYTNSHGTRFESSNQNLYIPKVGIAWTGEFTAPNSVCTWRPSVEAGYVWNLGDRSVDSNVFLGTTVAPIEYDTVDKSSYYAKAGMEFMCKNFTAGVFYRYLKGSAVRNNKWNINVSWAF